MIEDEGAEGEREEEAQPDDPQEPAPEVSPEPEPEPEAEAGAAEDAQPDAQPEAAAEPTEEPQAAPRRERPPAPEKKDQDVVPGANLEPIAIEEERELSAEERARLEAEEEERASREAAASAEDDEELPRRAAVSVPSDAAIQATGKRKTSIARVILRSGGGAILVNGRGLDDYFPRPHHQSMARQPLVTAGYDGSVDVAVRVHGGGIAGQAGAVRHGIARALVELDPELRGDLKRRGLLTRDAREKERRKAGLKKARKRPQFSKR